jgi:glycosyltransferase involved in cell wall biosynthesis
MNTPRIAVFVATSGHSGVDRVVANLVAQWAAWGISVDLLKVRGHGPVITPAPAGVRIIDLGTRHVTGSLFRLARYLRRERPQALLSDKDRVNRIAILARQLARAGDTRLAVRLGTTLSRNLQSRSRWERWLQTRSVRWLYPHADAVLVPSRGVAEDLAQYTGLAPARIAVAASPIVTPALPAQAAKAVNHPWLNDPRVPVILGVGELCMRKDFETLIRAFAEVRATTRCRLVILGRGRRRPRLAALARRLGVGTDVDLPGFERNPCAYMARASVFVLSSRWEGMPVVLIEALACHTPVVATDCPSGPREVLDGQPVGELVPVGDPPAMARAIRRMLEADVPREAFESAIRDYGVAASATRYLQVLGVAVPAAAAGKSR